jgi:hypothetical protein
VPLLQEKKWWCGLQLHVTIAMNKGLLMNAEDMDKIKPGMIIFYNLPLSYKPRKPLREWERS